MKKLNIPLRQLQSDQKAVDIMLGERFIGINVSKEFAEEFVELWNLKNKIKGESSEDE